MHLIDLLRDEALRRGLLHPADEIDAATVFALVRDMPYRRASDRRPETIISEWQGTCSGKHYLLQGLFAELGLPSQIIACTAVVPVDREQVPDHLLPLYESASRRFVDVHNYLLVALPGDRSMVVDATWPLSAAEAGLTANPAFIPGQDQQIAAELLIREEVIRALGERTAE